MKGTKLLLSFWLSTAVFCLLQILFGPGGISETARLKDQQIRLETRLEALRTENSQLAARYDALRTGTEEIRLEARALGYFRPGDVPVRTLDGVGFRLPSEAPDLSTVPSLHDTTSETALFFRLAWLLIFLVFYTFFYLIGRMWPESDQIKTKFRDVGRNLPVPLQTGLDFFRK